jgi:hypothetical protein
LYTAPHSHVHFPLFESGASLDGLVNYSVHKGEENLEHVRSYQ